MTPVAALGGVTQPGVLMERGLEDGKTEMFRIDQQPDNTKLERTVVAVELVGGHPVYTFNDGSYQIDEDTYTADGRIQGGWESDRIEEGDRRHTTYDRHGSLRNDRFYDDSGYTERAYDENGEITGVYFRNLDGSLRAGTRVEPGVREVWMLDGSHRITLANPPEGEPNFVATMPDGSVTSFYPDGRSATGHSLEDAGVAETVAGKILAPSVETPIAILENAAENPKHGLPKAPTAARFAKVGGPIVGAGISIGYDLYTGGDPGRAIATGLAGAAAGAGAGALAMSWFPGIGTFGGFVVGGAAGFLTAEGVGALWDQAN